MEQKPQMTCKICGKKLFLHNGKQYYGKTGMCQPCTMKSRSGINSPSWKGGEISTTCDFCKKEIKVKQCNTRKHKNHFCSKNCYDKFQVGQKRSKVIMDKRECKCGCGEVFECRPNSKKVYEWGHNPSNTTWKKGNNAWNKGIHKRLNTGRTHFKSGELSIRWKGGVTNLRYAIRNLPKFKEWLRAVLYKDNYTCNDCGHRGGSKLEVHHIYPYHKLLKDFCDAYSNLSPIDDTYKLSKMAVNFKPFWNVDNGMVLCEECHLKQTKKENYYAVR